MEIDELLELVKKRRSVRQFKPDQIPDEHVEKIIETARWAMSGANAQPWEFIVVKNKATINKIAELSRQGRMETYALEQARIDDLRHPSHRHPTGLPGWMNAPVLIVVIGDRRPTFASVLATNLTPGEAGTGATYNKGVGNATQNLCLAAAALGLGTQWVSVSRSWEQGVKNLLAVPDALGIHTIVPVGYATSEPKPVSRREFKEMVHFEKYDSRKYRSMEDVVNFLYQLRKRTRPAYPEAADSNK